MYFFCMHSIYLSLNVQKRHVLNQRINGGMIHCLHMYIDFSQFIPDFWMK